MNSDNEAWFSTRWLQLGGPEPMREHVFHEDRKWRFDFAWPDLMVALEIEGRGHDQWNRYHADLEKYNAAAFDGWTVVRLSFLSVKNDDILLLEQLLELLQQRAELDHPCYTDDGASHTTGEGRASLPPAHD